MWHILGAKKVSHYYINRLTSSNCFVRRQSIKKPNFLNSEPASSRSTFAMVALCSGDFELYSDASSITPYQLIILIDALEWVCV